MRSPDFLFGLVLGGLLSALIAVGGFADEVTPQIVAERDAQVAQIYSDALVTLLNRKPIQVGDAYVQCRVTPIESYSLYVSNYWKDAL